MLAVAAVLMITAVGCSKKEASAGGSSAKSLSKLKAQKDPATKKVYDFEGMEVIYGDWWSDPEAPAASKQQEDERAFRQWVMDTYNVKVTQMAVAGWGSNPQFVSNFCITGGDENYVFTVDGRSAIVGVNADLFYDLSTIKNVNWKAEKWEQGAINRLKIGDSFYCFNIGKPEPKNGLIFNKRILEENGIDPDAPYDLQKSGNWTWETFEEMCKKITKDTDNDGIIDQYAMSSFNTEFSYSALDSNGAQIVGRDENGKYYYDAGSEKAMEAWEWIAKMFKEHQRPQKEDENWDYFYTAFMNGETAFLADQEYNCQPNGRLSTMKDDWGFVCFPLGPSGDKVYRTIHDSNMVVLPSCYDADRANKIMKAVDLWSDPVPGYDGEDSWKDGYYAGFRDERAVDETLQMMMDNPNPRFDTLIPGIPRNMIWDICGGWQTPQEAFEASKNIIQALLDDCNR